MLSFADPEVWRFTAAVVVAVLVALLLRDHAQDESAQAFAFLAVGVIAHLVLPLLLQRAVPVVLLHGTLLLTMSVPFAFWLAARIHFDDGFRARPHHVLLLVAFLAPGYLSWLAVFERRLGYVPSAAAERFWLVAPRLLALTVVLHALITIYVGARSDLVLARLKARYRVLFLAGTYILLELLGELVFTRSPSEALANQVHSVGALILAVVTTFLSLKTRPDLLKPPRSALERSTLDPALAQKLRQLVEDEQVFREEGLTIGGLAERLGIQEYKARQLINLELGFRNFNAFLHHVRVGEAQKVLADPDRAHLGVAQVAYEVGYGSLATFNRAFKELTGRTPTDFRASRPPDAALPPAAD